MSMAIWTGSISPTGSALKTGGPDGGARVSFDIPEDGMGAYLELVLMRGKPLRIVVTEADEPLPFEEPDDHDETPAAAHLEDEFLARDEMQGMAMAQLEDEIPF